MKAIITLQQFYDTCPATLSRPADVFIVEELLWHGLVDTEKLTLRICGVDRRPALITEITTLFPTTNFSIIYDDVAQNCEAQLYAAGSKVASCPTNPAHVKSECERIYDLEQTSHEVSAQRLEELENRIKKLEEKN